MLPCLQILKSMSVFSLFKKILGEKLTKKIRPLGHGIKGYLASIKYGRPAQKLKIIGITGTKGKTTTSMYLGRMLNISGIKTGYITTGSIYLGEANSQNTQLMNTIEQIEEIENELKTRIQ